MEKELYRFECKKERHRRGLRETSYISLEGEAYKKFPGMHVFFDYEQINKRGKIEYEFAEGLLGIRVMKSYRFIR